MTATTPLPDATPGGKVMDVAGTKVPAASLDAALESCPRVFASSDLRRALARLGVPYGALDRAADRHLQARRKAGEVSFEKGKWTKVAR